MTKQHYIERGFSEEAAEAIAAMDAKADRIEGVPEGQFVNCTAVNTVPGFAVGNPTPEDFGAVPIPAYSFGNTCT